MLPSLRVYASESMEGRVGAKAGHLFAAIVSGIRMTAPKLQAALEFDSTGYSPNELSPWTRVGRRFGSTRG